MANIHDLFEKGETVDQKFESGEAVQEPQEYSTLGAVGMGALKGASFGFDDEFIGFAKAAIDKGFKGSGKDLWDLYRQHRDEMRTAHKQAEEQHPIASFGGEMAGAIIPAALSGGGAAVAKGAGVLGKAAAMANIGAKAGALGALGTTEANLAPSKDIELAKAVEDVGSGAATGGIVGGSLSLGGSAIKGIAGKIAENKIPKTTINVIKRTLKGEELEGDKAAQKIGEEVKDTAKNVLETVQGLASKQGEIQANSLKSLDQLGVNIDGNKAALNIEKRFGSEINAAGLGADEVEKVRTLLVEVLEKNIDGNGNISPTNLNSMLMTLTPDNADVSTAAGKRALGIAKDELMDMLRLSVGNVGNKNSITSKSAEQAMKNMLETKVNLDKGTFKFFNKLGLPERASKYTEGEQEAGILALRDYIKKLHIAGSDERVDIFDAMKGLIERFPKEAAEMINKMDNSSEKQFLVEALRRESPFGEKGWTAFLGKDANIARAAKTGIYTAKAIKSPIGQTIVKGSKAIYNLPSDSLSALAQLAEQKNLDNFAIVLRKVATAPEAKRRALLFTLMQQPTFRDFAREYIQGDDDESGSDSFK